MKHCIHLLFALFCLNTWAQHVSLEKNAQITLELDASVSDCEQWAYLHHYDKNEHIICDSVFIKKGSKEITLKTNVTIEKTYTILFTRKGPVSWRIILSPNTSIRVPITEADGPSPAKYMQGADANNERLKYTRQTFAVNQHLRNLQAKAAITTGPSDQKKIREEIAHCIFQLDSLQMDKVKSSSYVYNAVSALNFHFKGKVTQDSLETLCNIALKRFPNHPQIMEIKEPWRKEKNVPESETSKEISRRIGKITQERLTALMQQQTPNDSEERTETDVSQIASLSLLSDKGKMVSISELKGEVILIDFLASWCIPCREGVPFLKLAKEKYGDRLTICLVSLDMQRYMWKNLIEQDSLEDFLNLTATNESGILVSQVAQMNIKFIPYNVLLDEHRNIIATDIHKEKLLNKLKEILE